MRPFHGEHPQIRLLIGAKGREARPDATNGGIGCGAAEAMGRRSTPRRHDPRRRRSCERRRRRQPAPVKWLRPAASASVSDGPSAISYGRSIKGRRTFPSDCHVKSTLISTRARSSFVASFLAPCALAFEGRNSPIESVCISTIVFHSVSHDDCYDRHWIVSDRQFTEFE